MDHLKTLCLVSISVVLSAPLHAQVTVPHEFAAGEKAVAAEVNANFQALADALTSALAKIEELKTELATLKTSNAQALDEFVEVIPDPNVPGGTTVRFVGVNVQVVSGSGATDGEVNGLGNLIVGYNENVTDYSRRYICSLGEYQSDQVTCELNGGTWAEHLKSGSHNLVVGEGHRYSRYGGVVGGYLNAITGNNAAVMSGQRNLAAGEGSSIVGGNFNDAIKQSSIVVGGDYNEAAGPSGVVLGGLRNSAIGQLSTVLGGERNETTGTYSISPE